MSLSLPQLNADLSTLTVSGFSAGAFTATQLQVAFSDRFQGAGIMAGGAYWVYASSMETGEMPNDISVQTLTDKADDLAIAGKIADTANLKDKPIYLSSMSKDLTVDPKLVQKNQ